ncbi:MAG: hypothetical protein HRT42_12715, partial [Campylobacteraceae bacterium]|nr:hypothetical protein [Campylobacteraceae bacterium]
MRIYFLKITIILLFLSSSLIAIEENSIKEVMSIKIDQVFWPHFNNDMGLNQSYWPSTGPLAGYIQHYANNWYKYYVG